VRIWETATGRATGEPLRHRGRVIDASFSRDSSRLLTVTDDHAVRFWDVAANLPLSEPILQPDRIGSARLDPTGQELLTVCSDGKVQLWDIFSISGPAPAWLAPLAEGLGGLRFDANDRLQPAPWDSLTLARDALTTNRLDSGADRWASDLLARLRQPR